MLILNFQLIIYSVNTRAIVYYEENSTFLISELTFCFFYLNPIKPGGGLFLPAANLDLSYFWTARDMNLKLYDFS